MGRHRSLLTRFRDDRRGSASIWMLFWLTGFLALGGVAIDSANAWRMRAILQSSADAAAHAGAGALARADTLDRLVAEVPALAELDREDPVAVARTFAARNMAPEANGEVLAAADVELGRWNAASRQFTPGPAAGADAVRVTLRRAGRNANALPTHLLRLAGFGSWDIDAVAVARIFDSPRAACPDPVLALQTRADVQGNDAYVGICLQADVDLALGFAQPVIDGSLLQLLNAVTVPSTLAPVPLASAASGLLGGLVSDVLPDVVPGLTDLADVAAALSATADVVLEPEQVSRVDLLAGLTYRVSCRPDEVVYLPAGLDLTGVVLLSDCPVRAEQGLRLQATVIVANLASITRPELDLGAALEDLLDPALALGAEGPCRPGDGLQVLVFVDLDTVAGLTLFDPELLPIGGAVLGAHTTGTTVDGDMLASLSASLTGELLAGAGLDDLLGLCLGAQFMLHADALALAQ